jgi:hypothetical protein
MYRIMFVLKGFPEDAADFDWHWNVIDRLFKMFQWIFFASIVYYAADKTRVFGLMIVSGLLWCLLIILVNRFYVDYIHKRLVLTLGFGWPKLIKVVVIPTTILVLAACYWTIGAVLGVFEHYQSLR